jgi:chemotaxis protein methyltransferase CheR
VKPQDFQFVSELIKKRSGLVLSPEKIYLIESRLGPVARRHELESLEDLVAKLRVAPGEPLLREITEAMTTNESFFFRDKTLFDIFADHILPAFRHARAVEKKLKIWCAAASTGQEPYSLAMILNARKAELAGWNIDILGTDLSRDVLDKAIKGVYNQFEVQRGLPIQMLVKNFKKDGDTWEVNPEIRAMVKYREQNLLERFSGLGRFDVVFCRNVLIYFDQETKQDILNRIADILVPDGFVILGAAETVLGLSDRLKPVNGHRGLYSVSAETALDQAAQGSVQAVAS